MQRRRLDEIINIASGLLEPLGMECIEADWLGGERTLRLYIDLKAAGGAIDLDGCVKASGVLNESPDLDQAVSGPYTLEVSSPGVERPLRTRSHFESHLGRTVQVRLTEKQANRWRGQGRLLSVDGATQDPSGGTPVITIGTDEGPWSFPLGSLQRANLVFDWKERPEAR